MILRPFKIFKKQYYLESNIILKNFFDDIHKNIEYQKSF